jgi:hypothetical protein
MKRSILLAAALVLLAGVGCKKKESPPTDGSAAPGEDRKPGPGPGPKPQGPRDSIPLSEFPYDPIKPEVTIDLKTFSPTVPAKDPAAQEWLAKNGKSAEVRGVLGPLSGPAKSGREVYVMRDEFGEATITCESLFPPNWKKVSPGSVITVVGRIEAQTKGDRVEIRLTDAHQMAMPTPANDKTTADQIAQEYAADPKGFAAKWQSLERYDYVTGTLDLIEKTPSSGPDGGAYKFALRAGNTKLALRVQNPRGVEADPPKPGEQVTVLAHLDGHDGKDAVITGSGVYVGK